VTNLQIFTNQSVLDSLLVYSGQPAENAEQLYKFFLGEEVSDPILSF
jgi:hypothetical protein